MICMMYVRCVLHHVLMHNCAPRGVWMAELNSLLSEVDIFAAASRRSELASIGPSQSNKKFAAITSAP